jgi:exo-beta-1,3-glucanase (GH17 family)
VTSTIPEAIVYSPYNNDGSCKDADTVLSDLELISSKNIPSIRMYATDCNSLQTVQPAAQQLGLTINQGFWISQDGVDSIDSSVSDLITWGQENGWDIFTMIIVGNEAVNSGYCTWQELSSKITSVKAQLQAAGYVGPVGTAEPPVTFETSPGLCTAGNLDFVGINAHSYFAPTYSAPQAGEFVSSQISITQGVCPNLQVVVTETGYPSAGNTNGNNVPSPQNQALAIESLMQELNGECTILTTYNDYWKNPGPYNIEQHFGAIQLFD